MPAATAARRAGQPRCMPVAIWPAGAALALCVLAVACRGSLGARVGPSLEASAVGLEQSSQVAMVAEPGADQAPSAGGGRALLQNTGILDNRVPLLSSSQLVRAICDAQCAYMCNTQPEIAIAVGYACNGR